MFAKRSTYILVRVLEDAPSKEDELDRKASEQKAARTRRRTEKESAGAISCAFIRCLDVEAD
jgi:hypothetical protein